MNQPNTELNQTVDNLARQADGRFGGGTGGMTILTMIVILSGVLSAIFFWENSTQVFVRVMPPVALVLGLAVGLLPSEGAFFGWKKVRESKHDMTKAQMSMTAWGIGVAVFSSIFSTFALFVSNFPDVPETIRQYSGWFTFLALSAPLLIQFALFATFVVNEMSVQQNYKRAKVGAMRFDSLMRFEQARVMAALLGMEAELNRQLMDYGSQVGTDNAQSFLGNRPRTMTDMPDYQLPPRAASVSAAQMAPALAALQSPARRSWLDRALGRNEQPSAVDPMAVLLDMIQQGQLTVPVAQQSNSTQDATQTAAPAPGQGQGNGPSSPRIGGDQRHP